MLTPKSIEIIDVYKGYSVCGSFEELRANNLENFLLKCPEGVTANRCLTDMLIWNQYVVVGCSNGCIEVYNSDTY